MKCANKLAGQRLKSYFTVRLNPRVTYLCRFFSHLLIDKYTENSRIQLDKNFKKVNVNDKLLINDITFIRQSG